MAERKVRSIEERVAELDSKIKFHVDCAQKLQEKKNEILRPQKKKTVNELVEKAIDAGMTEAEIAEKLGITL